MNSVSTNTLILEGDLTIVTATQTCSKLRAATTATPKNSLLSIEFKDVSNIDLTLLQLLKATQVMAQQNDIRLSISSEIPTFLHQIATESATTDLITTLTETKERPHE